jgi:hypothetical protein
MKRKDPRPDVHASFQERLDPNGEHRQLMAAMTALSSRPGAWLMRRLGIEQNTLEEERAAPQRFAQLMEGLDEVADTFVCR